MPHTNKINAAKRIQHSRRKGQPLPEGAVYVGRPSMWGNPFMGRQWGHAKSVLLHARWIEGRLGALTLEKMGFCPAEIDALDRRRCWVLSNLHRLAGKDLACWCPASSGFCHADALIHLAVMHAQYERHAL